MSACKLAPFVRYIMLHNNSRLYRPQYKVVSGSGRPIFTHMYVCLSVCLSVCQLAKKVQLALIRSQLHTFQWAIYELWMLPLSPTKGSTEGDFAFFACKIQILLKQSLLQSFFVWKLPVDKL